jgi:Helicase HerA, central domain
MKHTAKAHRLLAAGTATLIAEPALAMAHQGGIGVIVGLAVGAAAYALIDDVEMVTGKQLSLPARRQSAATTPPKTRGKSPLFHRLLVGKSVREEGMAPSELEEVADDDPEDESIDLEELLELGELHPHVDTVLSNRVAILGMSGAGKSNLVADLVEELGQFDAPLIVLDHKGEYGPLCAAPYLLRPVRANAQNLTPANARAFAQTNVPVIAATWPGSFRTRYQSQPRRGRCGRSAQRQHNRHPTTQEGEYEMVRGRLIPTSYFRDPDVMSLSSGDIRLILVGLVLHADDWGRGLAHTVILGRDLDYPPEVIETALTELEGAELVQCYQAGKHRYYVLTRWDDWQKLPEAKRTPSRLPAPPIAESADARFSEIPDFSGEIPGNPGKSGENPPESESNQNPKGIRIEDEEAQPPPNVLPFPAARTDADSVFSEKTVIVATKQVADILKLPLTDDLARVVADYLGSPGLSLLGEADAAAEWIGDPRRNRKHQHMTPAFFRRWLKRETETAGRGSMAPGAPATNSVSRASVPPAQARIVSNGAGPPGTAPSADNPYHTFVQERAEQLLRRASEHQHEEASHETTS